jgi:hypothetical protein
MTYPVLSRIPFLGKLVDERFLDHRRRSSSMAGFATLILAGCIFEYRIFANHVIDWEMAAIIATFAVVKLTLFTWYRLND